MDPKCCHDSRKDVDFDGAPLRPDPLSATWFTTFPILTFIPGTLISHLRMSSNLGCLNSCKVLSDTSAAGKLNVHPIETWKALPTGSFASRWYSGGWPKCLATVLLRASKLVSSGFRGSAPSLVLATRRMRNVRSESGDLYHANPWGLTVKGAMPLLLKVSFILSRKSSLFPVVRDNGRDRLMCSGRGDPKSLVRKLKSLTSLDTCSSISAIRVVSKPCCTVEGCPAKVSDAINNCEWELTFSVDMTWPISDYMRNLTFPSLMQTRIINNTLSHSRSIQIMKCIWQRRHRRSCICISIYRIVGTLLTFGTVRFIFGAGLGWRIIDEGHAVIQT